MAKKKAKPAARKTIKKKAARPAPRAVARKKTAKKAVKKAAKAKKPAGKRVAPAAGQRAKLKKTAKKPVRVVAAKPKAAVRPKPPRRTKQTLPPVAPPGPTLVERALTADVLPPLEAPPLEAEVLDNGLAAPPPLVALQVGDPAPDFELADEAGMLHRLSDYHGQRVVLYFYPKDDTPGCTREACGFRDRLGDFSGRNVAVLGVSPAPIDSHRRFVQKFGLTFPLLADLGHKVAEQYGVWVEKNLYGKPSMGIARTTFLIDAAGRIQHIFRNVQADGHEQEVLDRML
jgi:thioredoxin-dependent peroxiredoxin